MIKYRLASSIVLVLLSVNSLWPSSKKLMKAVKANDLALVKKYVGKRASPNASVQGEIILHVAAFRGHEKVFHYLLSKGGNIYKKDSGGNSALWWALQQISVNSEEAREQGKLRIARFLAKEMQFKKYKFPWLLSNVVSAFEPRSTVCQKDNDVVCHGKFSAEGLEMIKTLVRKGLPATIGPAFQSSYHTSVISIAAVSCDYSTFSFFLQNKAVLRANDWRLISSALACKDDRFYEHLLKAGLNLNVTHGAEQVTTMHVVAQGGFLKRMKKILSQGGKVNAIFSGGRITPLHLAAEAGHADVVRFLLQNGARAVMSQPACKVGLGGCPQGEGGTPLMLAARRGHAEVMRALLEAGAKADQYIDNQSAESIVEKNQRSDLIKLIQEYSKKK